MPIVNNIFKAAEKRYNLGNYILPSPDEVMEAMDKNGNWSPLQLAEWGVSWPPPKGWKLYLETEWIKNRL